MLTTTLSRTPATFCLTSIMHKAGLVELLEDDRATLLGAMIEIIEQLQQGGPEGKEAESLKARWKRKGMRAFEADAKAGSTAG
jgi:hypothetical protein